MMRYIYIVIVSFLYCANVHAQSIDFVFNEKLNALVTKKEGKAPTVFEILSVMKADTVVVPSSKKISSSYTRALTRVKSAKKDSITAAGKVVSGVKPKASSGKYSDISKIQRNINSFLASNSNFDSKKNLLIAAQKLSTKNKLNQLIYADANINSSSKSKFFVLSRNELDLKVHLKKVVWKMKSLASSQTQPAVAEQVKKGDNTEINNRLKEARSKLKKTKKYQVIPSKMIVSNTSETLELRRNVFNPERVVVGSFTSLGTYYVTKEVNTLKARSLVSVKEAKIKGLTEADFLFKNSFIIVKNINTKSIYMVYPGFVEKYAINKIALQEKYKNIESLSDKKYSNDSERELDSMVLDYNKYNKISDSSLSN